MFDKDNKERKINLTTKFLISSVILFLIVIISLNFMIYYDFKNFFIKIEEENIKSSIMNFLHSNVKYRIYFNKWDSKLDYSILISEFSNKFQDQILHFGLYTNTGEKIYSSCNNLCNLDNKELQIISEKKIISRIITKKDLEYHKINRKLEFNYINEISVAILQDNQINGIIKIYKPFDDVYKNIKEVRFKAIFLSIICMIIYIVALIFIVIKIDKKENVLINKIKMMEKLYILGQFASKIAHEIGNPLNIISWNVEIIEESQCQDNISDKINSIKRQINKINRIVRNYLYASKKPNPILREIELDILLKQIYDDFKYLLDDNIQLILEPKKYIIKADDLFLEQVISNIIKNAADAIGDKDGIIKIYLDEYENYIRINIADNGPGIPEEIKNKIFETFFTTKTTSKGSGLGLSVCKELIESMEGKITFSSKQGETVFTIWLKKC